MDRFKGFINVVVIQHIAIYIPVWIDLKIGSVKSNLGHTSLYIPVWIDLKKVSAAQTERYNSLYIPVWIDLKT